MDVNLNNLEASKKAIDRYVKLLARAQLAMLRSRDTLDDYQRFCRQERVLKADQVTPWIRA